MQPFELNEKDRDRVKEILRNLDLAREANRRQDRHAFKIIISNINIKESIIAPLENISKWDPESDEKIITKLSSKIKEEIDSKTLEKVYGKIQKTFDNNGGLLGRLLAPLKKKKTKNNEQMKLKRIVGFLKIASQLKFTVFHDLVAGNSFALIVMSPLKEMSGWDAKDDAMTKRLYEKLNEKTLQKKTLKEKSDEILRLLTLGGKVAVVLGITGTMGGLTYYFFKKIVQKTEE